jgi:hypothetical protein
MLTPLLKSRPVVTTTATSSDREPVRHSHAHPPLRKQVVGAEAASAMPMSPAQLDLDEITPERGQIRVIGGSR